MTNNDEANTLLGLKTLYGGWKSHREACLILHPLLARTPKCSCGAGWWVGKSCEDRGPIPPPCQQRGSESDSWPCLTYRTRFCNHASSSWFLHVSFLRNSYRLLLLDEVWFSFEDSGQLGGKYLMWSRKLSLLHSGLEFRFLQQDLALYSMDFIVWASHLTVMSMPDIPTVKTWHPTQSLCALDHVWHKRADCSLSTTKVLKRRKSSSTSKGREGNNCEHAAMCRWEDRISTKQSCRRTSLCFLYHENGVGIALLRITWEDRVLIWE